MKKYSHCLVVGKFMPPHKGHELLIRFAQESAEQVHVIVDCLANQTISPEQRKQWIVDQIPNVKVYALTEFMPQDPSETPDFWDIWKRTIQNTVAPHQLDLVVAAMDYGYELAEVLDCAFIPIDIDRESIPISATLIRGDMYQNFDYLMDSVKPSYVKKICFLGPESTGKSTLGKKVAQTLGSRYVPEYAKAILEKEVNGFCIHHVSTFVNEQIKLEKTLARFSNQFLICDSSAITTKIYAEMFFHESFSWIDEVIQENKYHHYFLFKPDTPFINAAHRINLNDVEPQEIIKYREFEFNKFLTALNNFGFHYTIVDGDWAQREKIVLDYIENNLK